jgi:hypothetical protein
VLHAKREPPRAGYEPLDTAVQHGRFIPRQKGGLKAIGHNSRH